MTANVTKEDRILLRRGWPILPVHKNFRLGKYGLFWHWRKDCPCCPSKEFIESSANTIIWPKCGECRKLTRRR